LIDKIIFKDQSKMELGYKSGFSLRPSWAPPDQITYSQFVPPLPAAAMKKEQDIFVGLTVPDHDGGRPIEVNACILITHMVYL
jgi:hypothetical protein